MVKSLIHFCLCVFCFFASSVHGKDNSNLILDGFFQSVQSLQADFVQTVRNTQGRVLEQSNGILVISRPDKFILDYQIPVEQKYISNGKTIWIYDIELEQVNIQSLEQNLGETPALLLSSNADIYNHYQVNDVIVSGDDEYQWVQLTAKATDMTFERVLLAFKENALMQMRMHDSFGQVTELKFSNIELNKLFPEQKFNFIPPDDVDVIGAAHAQ